MSTPTHGESPEGGSVLRAAVLGRCPRCGKGRLFRGYLKVADGCELCGLSYQGLEAGDGPAVFVILIVGFIVTGAALFVEVTYSPPYWVHALLWAPAVPLLSFGLLRFLKAWLLIMQFRHRAEEGRQVR
jgi:uncharacterized protein (DUF983 family)